MTFRLTLLVTALVAAVAPAARGQEPAPVAPSDALAARVRRPVALEARSFHLFLDREDSTFRLRDDGGAVDWHPALDRRGFASVLVRGEGGIQRKLPVDRVEDLRVTGKSIRFRGASSGGALPEIDFELRVTEPLVGLEISFEVGAGAPDGGVAVEILDRALWIADSEGGGALLPVGLGEWQAADRPGDFRRRLSSALGTVDSLDGADPGNGAARPTLSCVGLMKANAGLLVVWDRPEVVVEVAGEAVSAEGFLGARAVATSVVARGTRGAVRLFPLGRLKDRREIPLSYAQLAHYGDPVPSLRFKTGFELRHRAFASAALFTVDFPTADSGGDARERGSPTFDGVLAAAARLRQRLEIGDALFLLDNWHDPAAKADGWHAAVRADLGGGEGLRRLVGGLRAIGYLSGLSVSHALAAPPRDGDGDDLEPILELGAELRPDLLFAPEDAGSPVGATADDSRPFWLRHRDLAAGLAEKHVLLGSAFVVEEQLRAESFLRGVIGHRLDARDGGRYAPFFHAVYGGTARFAPRRPEPLRPGDTERFLSYLLLGEVPEYALPAGREGGAPSGGGDASPSPLPIYARCHGGWGEGRDLTPEEVFLKNTYEVLGHLAGLRHRTPVFEHRRRGPDGSVEEILYGFDLRIVVNRGETVYEDEEEMFTLPPRGFWVQHPFFVAFHALRAFEHEFAEPALFTVRSLEGKLWLRAEKVRIWHGFGPSRITLGGKEFDVPRQLDTRIW